ncbi:MAG: hypothetical protein U0T74_08050 [Chitinophagales bacterium]
MKSFLLSVILIVALCALLQSFLPWWTIAVASFVVGYFVKQKAGLAFAAGFVGVFVLWVVYAYVVSSANEHLLAYKITELLKALTQGSLAGLYVLTGFIGGLVSGFAALSGSLAAKLK